LSEYCQNFLCYTGSMEPREIYNNPGIDLRKAQKLNNAFISSEILRKADIAPIVEDLSRDITTKLKSLRVARNERGEDSQEKVEVILQLLNAENILLELTVTLYSAELMIEKNQKGDPPGSTRLSWRDENRIIHSDTITPAELEPFLDPIREAVLDKLSGLLPREVTARIARHYKVTREIVKTRTQSLMGDLVSHELIGDLTKEDKKAQIQALKYLLAIPESERSPYIFWEVQALDSSSGITLNQEIKLTTLSEFLKINPLPKLDKMLGYMVDAIKGHQFLIKHGLRLRDNDLKNIGIDIKKDRGMLFDYDYLRLEGKPVYVSKNNPIQELDIVYELGYDIIQLFYPYYMKYEKDPRQNQKKYQHVFIALKNLSDNMTTEDPSARPSLQEARTCLETIIYDIND